MALQTHCVGSRVYYCFIFVDFGYSPSRTPGVNSEGNAALKRPDTNESLNSSMSNGTTDAGIQTYTHD